MIYRHQEILRALADNEAGLTTAQLVKECRKKAGSEITDVAQVSTLVYSLRGYKHLTTSDASGGKVHRITALGKTKLIESENEESGSSAVTDKQSIDDLVEEEIRQETEAELMGDPESSENITLDGNNELEAAFITIISALKAASSIKPAPVIERKEQKIDTLQRLGALMSDDIRFVLTEIVCDLENMEVA
jgi:hypothetical protein